MSNDSDYNIDGNWLPDWRLLFPDPLPQPGEGVFYCRIRTPHTFAMLDVIATWMLQNGRTGALLGGVEPAFFVDWRTMPVAYPGPTETGGAWIRVRVTTVDATGGPASFYGAELWRPAPKALYQRPDKRMWTFGWPFWVASSAADFDAYTAHVPEPLDERGNQPYNDCTWHRIATSAYWVKHNRELAREAAALEADRIRPRGARRENNAEVSVHPPSGEQEQTL